LELVQHVETAVNTAQSVKNEYDMIGHQITQITHQVQNLQRLPEHMVHDVLNIGRQVTDVIGDVKGLGFDISTIAGNFSQLYPQIKGTLGSGQAFAMQQQWVSQRQTLSGVAMQAQSISRDLVDRYTKLATLMSQSHAVQGNLDAQQITHQQQALAQLGAMQSQQLQALRDRLETQKIAEETVREQIRLHETQRALGGYVNTTQPYKSDGKLFDYEAWYR
jgi:P-type conjugative transfer protein TrbJ